MTRSQRGDYRFDRRVLGEMDHHAVAGLADLLDGKSAPASGAAPAGTCRGKTAVAALEPKLVIVDDDGTLWHCGWNPLTGVSNASVYSRRKDLVTAVLGSSGRNSASGII